MAVLIADRSGTEPARGPAQLARQRGTTGISIELPRAAGTTLLLTVPPGVVPTATAGLASLVEEQADRHVYTILLGGASEMTLRTPRARLLRQPISPRCYCENPRSITCRAAWTWRPSGGWTSIRIWCENCAFARSWTAVNACALGETELPFSPLPDATAVDAAFTCFPTLWRARTARCDYQRLALYPRTRIGPCRVFAPVISPGKRGRAPFWCTHL